MTNRLSFVLPAGLQATEPPEQRGLGRDGVRMMVAHRLDGRLVDSKFGLLPSFLTAEDLLVINTSATLAAAVTGTDVVTGGEVVVHLSTRLGDRPDGAEVWVVEPRRPAGLATKHWPSRATVVPASPTAARELGQGRCFPGAARSLPAQPSAVDRSTCRRRPGPNLAGRARPAHPLRVCPPGLAA